MFNTLSFVAMFEYLRRVENVSVTEEGNYLEDEVPDDYAGSILTMVVVHEVIMADENGQLFQQVFSPPISLNKDGEPSEGKVVDGNTVEEGDTPTKITTIYNENLSTELVGRIQKMIEYHDLPEDT